MKTNIIALLMVLQGAVASANVPAHLLEADNIARAQILKVVIEKVRMANEDITYNNFTSTVGKYGQDVGIFSFNLEIWQSNHLGYKCYVPYTTVVRTQQSWSVTYLNPDYIVCKQIFPAVKKSANFELVQSCHLDCPVSCKDDPSQPKCNPRH